MIFLQRLRELPKPTRACLVDKNFLDLLEENLIEETQFKNRCEIFELPAITSRMRDLAYIFARSCFDAAFGVPGRVDTSNKMLKIDEESLVRAVNWVLGSSSTGAARIEAQIGRGRGLVEHAKDIGSKLREAAGGSPSQLTLKTNDLPRPLRAAAGSSANSNRSFDFIWTNS